MGDVINDLSKVVPFSTEYKGGVNLEDYNSVNRHNEAGIGAVCGEDTFVDDNFDISVSKQANGDVVLSVNLDSEVIVGLWKHGRVDLRYDNIAKKWGVVAYHDIQGEKEWLMCRPDAVLNNITAGLECFVNDMRNPDTERETIAILKNSISNQTENIISSARLYGTETDCNGREVAEIALP